MNAASRNFVALLRGVNVGGHNKIPMVELRRLCAGIGWRDVHTYIQSGNVVFRSEDNAADLERDIEQAIRNRLGLEIPVIVRSAEQWGGYLARNPFPEASDEDPKLVMIGLSKKPTATAVAPALLEYARDGESVEQRGDALWIHFRNGSARSKLSPSVLDRVVGSPVTCRNWRTAEKLAELLAGRDG